MPETSSDQNAPPDDTEGSNWRATVLETYRMIDEKQTREEKEKKETETEKEAEERGVKEKEAGASGEQEEGKGGSEPGST